MVIVVGEEVGVLTVVGGARLIAVGGGAGLDGTILQDDAALRQVGP